jgi:copper transport protein
MIGRLPSRAALLLALCAAALALPAAASAHASLVRTEPPAGTVLRESPRRVVVTLDDEVRVGPGNAAIRNGGRSILADAPTVHGKTLVLPLREGLGDGDYSVRWSVVSDDGHDVQGVFAFAVGAGRGPPVVALSVTGQSRLAEIVSRWIFFAGLLVASGLALFDVLVWRPLARRGLGTGWIAIGLAAMFVSSHGLVHQTHGGGGTRFGLVVQIASVLAATGAAAAAIAIADAAAAPFALVPAILVLVTPTLAGHALDPGRSWLNVPLDLAHVVASALWIGGLFALAVVVPRRVASPDLVKAAAQRFSKLALGSVLVLAATGVGRALVELDALAQLWTTGYGRALLAKTALFAVLIGVGALSRARLEGAVERLRTAVSVELALVLGVVVAVAWLTALRPGRR